MRYTLVAAHIATLHALILAPGLCPRGIPAALAHAAPHLVASPAASPRRAHARMQLALPAEGYEGAVGAGAKKASNTASKIFALGMMSGAHIGFGGFLMMSVGGSSPALAIANPGLSKIVLGAFGIPFGLMMTLVTGAELFTGNTALVTAALIEGKVKAGQLAKSWIASYAGNFVGSVALAALVFHGGTLAVSPAPVAMATFKVSLSFKQAFIRGILCNWLGDTRTP
jgi:formate/nitrite transporter FocA (FNT family)